MESKDGRVSEVDRLEKGLLSETRNNNDCNDDDEEEEEKEATLYSVSFKEAEDDFIKLKTTQWILYSLLLILAWGIGLLMLLYLPVRRYILRRMIRSRKLYITPDSIVYKVTKPVPFPCFGALKKEKHVLLASVADVVIEQGYLQSRYGVYSIRIENVGVRRAPSDDVQIEGITDPESFRKVVLTRLSNIRSRRRILEDVGCSRREVRGRSSVGEFAILEKLEEVGNSLKRVQSLIERHHSNTTSL